MIAWGNVASGWDAGGDSVAATPNVREYYPQLALTPDQSSLYVVYASGLIGNTSLILKKFNTSNGSGAGGWPGTGIILSPGPYVYPEINHDLKLYTDAANDAVVFWIEANLTANGEVYMQQVNPSSGQMLNGGSELYLGGDLGPNDGTGEGIDYLEVEQDADYNFLIAFNNLVNFNDVAAMRVKPNGTIIWNDTLITTGGFSAYPLAVPDGKRGMYIFYVNTNSPEKLYAIGIDSTGAIDAGWSLPGSLFGNMSDYDGFDPNYDFNAVSVQNGQAVVAWNRATAGNICRFFTCNLMPNGSNCTFATLLAGRQSIANSLQRNDR